MKWVLFCLAVLIFPTVGITGEYDYDATGGNVSDTILNAWGAPKINPGFIQDASDAVGNAFTIKSGYACCGGHEEGTGKFYLNTEDDVAHIGFIAQKNVSEHGAEFCLTQVHAASSTTTFYLRYQQPNWPGLPCAWFCEPGWDGIECKEQTSVNHACNTTNYAAAIDKVKKEVYSGNDAIAISGRRMGVADSVAFLDSLKIKDFYPHQIVLGAVEFKEHGIVVTPIILGAVGDHPIRTHVTAQKATSGARKTFCAQGYTNGEDCRVSSNQCGKEKLCVGYDEKKFDSKIHEKRPNGLCSVIVCKDESKGLDSNYKCVDCLDNIKGGRCNVVEHDEMGRCVECPIGKFFDETDCACKTARVLSNNQMKYGQFEGDVVTKQCWTMNDSKAFLECMLGTTTTK